MDEQIAVSLSRRALVAAVDAMLHHIIDYGLADCHDLKTLTAACSSELCAADMELLRVARKPGVNVTERLSAILSTAQ